MHSIQILAQEMLSTLQQNIESVKKIAGASKSSKVLQLFHTIVGTEERRWRWEKYPEKSLSGRDNSAPVVTFDVVVAFFTLGDQN